MPADLSIPPQRIEVFRNCVALLTDTQRTPLGSAISMPSQRSRDKHVRDYWCTCPTRDRMCYHRKELEALHWHANRRQIELPSYDAFRSSFWYKLAEVLWEARDIPVDQLTLSDSSHGFRDLQHGPHERVAARLAEAICTPRLLARLQMAASDQPSRHGRLAIWEALTDLARSESEKVMNEKGILTRGQHLERSLWFRLAYHCYREWGDTVHFQLHRTDDPATYRLHAEGDRQPLFELTAKAKTVRNLLPVLGDHLETGGDLAEVSRALVVLEAQPIPATHKLTVRPVALLIQADGGRTIERPASLTAVALGDTLCLPRYGAIPLSEPIPRPLRELDQPQELAGDEIPLFLQAHQAELAHPDALVPDALRRAFIHGEPETLELIAHRLSRDWCWMDIHYVSGTTRLNLHELLQGRQQDQRFLKAGEHWIDLQAWTICAASCNSTPAWTRLSSAVCVPTCATTRRSACAGSSSWSATASAACSAMTWAWAKPTRQWASWSPCAR